ncbi:MAG: LacI family DNA-binding transcriptional regulator [Clostridia bacterium]|nr:LacI family DNA-binding transcriptional regulator [Clostridia bacterium]
MISQKLIAEKAGVSYATVSRALTHSAKVRPETVQAIRKAMKELGIDFDEQLFTGRNVLSKMVLVVCGDISLDFFANIIVGIYDTLSPKGYSIVLCNSKYNSETELDGLIKAQNEGYAGVIMITATETPKLVSFLQNTTVPVVLVNRYIRSLDLDVVRIDNYRGGYLAAQHLFDYGHKKIAILSGPVSSSAVQDRLRGFKDALTDCSVPFDENESIYKGDLTQKSGKVFAEWINRKDYTAAFITNDHMTVGTVNQLSKLGKRVPEDISIVSFDDSVLINEDGLNITSISFEAATMGVSAAEILLKRISDPLGRHIKMIYSPIFSSRSSVKRI